MKIKVTDILSFIASNMGFTPTGGISATTVQAAIAEVDSEKVTAVASTDNVVARFDGTAGAIQTSGVTIDDSNNITGANTLQMGTGLAASSRVGVGTTVATWQSGTNSLYEVTESSAATATGVRRGFMMTMSGTGSAGTTASMTGLSFDIRWASTGTSAGVQGINGIIRNTAAGTVTAATAGSLRVRNDSTGTITSSVGLDVLAPANAGGGAITTNFGVRIGAMAGTGITTGWALQSTGASDISAIAGKLRLGGVTAPTNPLSVTGNSDFSGTIQLPVYTIATLPAAAPARQKAFVSDALLPVFGVAPVAGGAVLVPVYSNGAGWVVG